MIQGGLPIPHPDSVSLPLPQTFERWRDLYLHDASQKIIAFVVMAAEIYFISRIIRSQFRYNIADINQRYILQ